MSGIDRAKYKLVRYAHFHGMLGAAGCDRVGVKNLQVTVNAGRDCWGREKSQPSLLTVDLHMSQDFQCQADALDNTTVHYGILSKNLKAQLEGGSTHRSTWRLAEAVESCIEQTAGQAQVRATEMDIFYPKASLLGEGAGFYRGRLHKAEVDQPCYSWVSYLRNLRIPCLIGVNDNERLAKQPLIVSIWLDQYFEFDTYFKLEQAVTKIISESAFETLELLLQQVIDGLRRDYFRKGDEETVVRLRVEKPMAVQFADAPVIEIQRQVGPIS